MRRHLVLSAALLVAIPFVFVACTPSTPSAPDVPLTPQQTNTFRIVGVGNSLTAGVINSGLRIDMQAAGFINRLAVQIWPASAGPRPPVAKRQGNIYLHMPLIDQPGVGTIPGQGPLYVNSSGAITADPLDPSQIPPLLLNATFPLAYDNLGVPQAFVVDPMNAIDAATSYTAQLLGAGNPFFNLILRNEDLAGDLLLPPGNTTQVDQATSLTTRETIVGLDSNSDPVFGIALPMLLTLWIGNNDILIGTASGDPVIGPIGSGNVTSSGDFAEHFLQIVAALADLGIPQAAVANIPNILGDGTGTATPIPFFSTIPTNPELLGFPAGSTWNTDESEVEFITLSATSIVQGPNVADYVNIGGAPTATESLPSTTTLTTTESNNVRQEIALYNNTIFAAATDRGWAYVDIASALGALSPDPTAQPINASFAWQPTNPLVNGQNAFSAFGVDGVHPSEKGYQEVANQFVAALNATYGTSYTTGDVSAVNNTIGFEQAPKRPFEAGQPWFTPDGLSVLRGIGGGLRP